MKFHLVTFFQPEEGFRTVMPESEEGERCLRAKVTRMKEILRRESRVIGHSETDTREGGEKLE
jgi:hypothetical protein